MDDLYPKRPQVFVAKEMQKSVLPLIYLCFQIETAISNSLIYKSELYFFFPDYLRVLSETFSKIRTEEIELASLFFWRRLTGIINQRSTPIVCSCSNYIKSI